VIQANITATKNNPNFYKTNITQTIEEMTCEAKNNAKLFIIGSLCVTSVKCFTRSSFVIVLYKINTLDYLKSAN